MEIVELICHVVGSQCCGTFLGAGLEAFKRAVRAECRLEPNVVHITLGIVQALGISFPASSHCCQITAAILIGSFQIKFSQ